MAPPGRHLYGSWPVTAPIPGQVPYKYGYNHDSNHGDNHGASTAAEPGGNRPARVAKIPATSLKLALDRTAKGQVQ
jgi:hypothetical protein